MTEEVEERMDEAPLEDPKEGARRMLRRGKFTMEKIMAETGLTRPVVTCLKGALAKKGELVETERKEGGEGYEDPYDQMVERMANKLLKELIKTPGVTEPKAKAIVSDFREDKTLRESEWELYSLILDYCPSAKPGLLARVLDRVFSIQDEYADTLAERSPVRGRRRVSSGRESVGLSRDRIIGSERLSEGFGRDEDREYIGYQRDRREQHEHDLRMRV